MDEIQKSYDELPYFSTAFFQCSPTRIEAIASFLSLTPPHSQNSRVLEIGCSYGGNLFPFAIANPNAKAVGIDLSKTQIDKAKELAKQMRVDNIKFIQKDICEVSQANVRELGEFDYIICHGVYSWVPDVVKDAILTSIKKLLSPNGIAYVSYNVYPGWKVKDIIRDFLTFGASNIKGEVNKAAKARELLNFLVKYTKYCENTDDINKIFLNSQLLDMHVSDLLSKSDTYICHEFLEIFNDPIYFKDFATNLDKHGLSYLCETSLDDIFKADLGIDEFDKYINSTVSSRIDKEQMLDFMVNKQFRQSLIIHKELFNNESHIEIGANELAKLHLASQFKRTEDGYESFGLKMKPEYNWLYQVFNDVYPDSVNFADIAALLKDDENALKSAFMGLMEIVATGHVAISIKPLKTIKYEVGKSRLKQNFRGYFEYFSANEMPVIGMANELNSIADFSTFDAFVALQFNGKNSLEAIEKQTGKFIKDRGLNLMENDKILKSHSKDDFKKMVKSYIDIIHTKLVNGYFLENI
ncbi:methyltransferase regulatory domain-containing protein [Campylobacter sp. faydin G-24]|uniref:Methyltransferase regulatory domain-containing protein n=1 Tax=Campylobacter anatolicus TaxID=2829105 RepID=A0ABS5HHH6_9BACT|nr:class I SAM-dependent methyltransferase [Campylobacter anatolicus]MBR8463588.1 methyltransferase regulatory domain-containing protein [Campylobacter anatolicus]